MKDMAQTERQIFILLLLSENRRGYTVQELRESISKWDEPVDQKTIRRDIDSLSRICFIMEEERNGKTYYSASKFKLNAITFTSRELISLSFLSELLKPYQHMDMGQAAMQMMNRIIDHTSNVNQEFIRHFNGIVNLNTNTYVTDHDVSPKIERLLNTAVHEHRKVRLVYHSFNSDEDTLRVLHPYELLINGGCLYVCGYCELRDSLRDFRVSRIKKLELLDDSFQVPGDYYKNKKREKFIHLSGEHTEKIVLHFNMEASRYIKEYESKKADDLICDNNGLTFIRETAVTDELIRWILGFGASVKVLEPEHLRLNIENEINKMAGQYLRP